MGKVWIEVALNGPWSRSRQPGIPDTVDAIVAEGIACAGAGACIVHVLGVDIRPLIPETVRKGGHVRVGLEDAPFGCTMTNLALVEEAAKLIRANGGEPATVAEMRATLSAAF
jgi:3-keto-5-aminohexanoate cleavage enzyme